MKNYERRLTNSGRNTIGFETNHRTHQREVSRKCSKDRNAPCK